MTKHYTHPDPAAQHRQRKLHTHLLHLDVPPPIKPRALHRRARHPPPHPDRAPRHAKDDQNGRQDAEAVAGDLAAFFAVRAGVQERVGVEALRVMRQVGERDVQQEDEEEEGEGEEGVRVGCWEDDFEQGEERVQAVVGDLGRRGGKAMG